jgi:hypothetical protein
MEYSVKVPATIVEGFWRRRPSVDKVKALQLKLAVSMTLHTPGTGLLHTELEEAVGLRIREADPESIRALIGKNIQITFSVEESPWASGGGEGLISIRRIHPPSPDYKLVGG